MNPNALIDEVRKIILKHARPERIYLYGSRATGEATETSDLDIAYDDKEFDNHALIEQEVQGLPTLLKIDVKNLAHAEERFRNRVTSTGKVLYSATKGLRFEDALYNYRNALQRFNEMVDRREEFHQHGFGDVYLDLAVKRFEFTFEMSWKAIKRYLAYVGIEALSPRACFKEAYAQKLIKSEDIWLDMIEQRNLTSHVYNQAEAAGILKKLSDYQAAFADLLTALETMVPDA